MQSETDTDLPLQRHRPPRSPLHLMPSFSPDPAPDHKFHYWKARAEELIQSSLPPLGRAVLKINVKNSHLSLKG